MRLPRDGVSGARFIPASVRHTELRSILR